MSFFTALVTSKIAASALAAGTVAVGGTAAAAYTGTLPTPLQESAHNLIGAPAPAAVAAVAAQTTDTATTDATATAEATETAEQTESETPSESPSGTPAAVDATGPAAYGLCQSFTNGGLDASSTAYKSLTVAADGETNIATYCATVASPGESASHRPSETGAEAAAAHIPAAPQPAAQAVVPAAPQQAVAPAAPQLPAQAVVPAAPQQAETGTAHKPATAGRP